MFKKISLLKALFVVVVSVTLYGCVVAAAGAGAAVTYSVTADSVVDDNVSMSKETLDEEFVNIVKDEDGKLLYVSISEGKVKGEIAEKKVFLDVEDSNGETSKIKITVRKGYQLLPDKDEAMRLYKKLVHE
jgi:hypothetical protein